MGAEQIHSDHGDKAQGQGQGHLPTPSPPRRLLSRGAACGWAVWHSRNARLGSAGRKCAKALPAPGTGRLGTGSCRASEQGHGGWAAARQPREGAKPIMGSASAGLLPLLPVARSSALLEVWCYPRPCLAHGAGTLGTPGRPLESLAIWGQRPPRVKSPFFRGIWTVGPSKPQGPLSGARGRWQLLEEPHPRGHRLLGRAVHLSGAEVTLRVWLPRRHSSSFQQKEGFPVTRPGRVFASLYRKSSNCQSPVVGTYIKMPSTFKFNMHKLFTFQSY